MTALTYLFYDIESTGLHKAFDQVLHFAAIRTDRELRELERYDIKIKLNPDTVPAPQALITHYIGVEEAQNGLAEHPAMLQIHALFNEPGTISLGYNTLGFDDEFLRFSFYRNLLAPYTHQFANQCGRMDLYPLTMLYYLYKNDILRWPERDGKSSFKLEDINAANQFIEGRSHHAMVDVEVTLALARKLFAAREMWDYATGYFHKNTDQQRAQQLPYTLQTAGTPHYEALMIYGKIGTADRFHAPVLFLGTSQAYSNQGLWLRLDQPGLTTLTADNLSENNKLVFRKKWGEPGILVPSRERYLSHLSPERQSIVADNKAWLAANPALFQALADYYRHYQYPDAVNVDVDAGLYLNGFWSNEENTFCRRFNQSKPQDKSSLADQVRNPVLKQLTLRLLGRNYPELLSSAQEKQFADHLQRLTATDPILDWQGKSRLTPKVALEEMDKLRKEKPLNSEQTQLLNDLERYLRAKFC